MKVKESSVGYLGSLANLGVAIAGSITESSRSSAAGIQERNAVNAVPLVKRGMRLRVRSDRSGRIREKEGTGGTLGRALPPRNILLQLFKLLLEPSSKDVDVVGSTIVDTPHEQSGDVDAAGPVVPEPDGAWDHG